jgi:hypothetical protein
LTNVLIKITQALFSLLEALHLLNKLQYLVRRVKKGKEKLSPSDLARLPKN